MTSLAQRRRFCCRLARMGGRGRHGWWVGGRPRQAASIGDFHSAVLTRRGRLYTFGTGCHAGQLGLGPGRPETDGPVRVEAGLPAGA